MISNREFSVQQATFKNGSSYKENQDSKSVWLKYPIIDTKDTDDIQITDNLVGFIGVYDGHDNIYGKITSKFVKNYFDTHIIDSWNLINSKFTETIKNIFYRLSNQLRQKLVEITKLKNFETREVKLDSPENLNYNYIEYRRDNYSNWKLIGGGTTISLQFFLENGDSYHVHLGDSECVLFEKLRIDGELKDSKINKNFTVITKNHSPDSLEEYDRIQNSRGNNAGLQFYDESSIIKTQPEIFNNKVKIDPSKLYSRGLKLYHKNIEGEWATLFSDRNYRSRLAMTRSMGDYYLVHAGLSHEPEIIKTDLSNTSSLLLASDGLWDNWKKKDLMDLYFKLEEDGKTDKDMFDNLMENTIKLAKENFGKSRDDITAIMVIL